MEGTPARPARSGKEAPMWVFDGEQWTEEGGSEQQTQQPAQNHNQQQFDMFLPELQVVENTQIVPVYIPFPTP